MLALHLSMIEVRLRAAVPSLMNGTDSSRLAKMIAEGLKDFSPSASEKIRYSTHELWNKAYQLERMIALIQPQEALFSELARRTRQAIDEGLPSASKLKESFDRGKAELLEKENGDGGNAGVTFKLKSDAGSVQRARMLLLDALEELHWASQRKFSARPLQIGAIRLATIFVFGAALLFVAPYLALYLLSLFGKKFDAEAWEWLPLFTALSAGLFGAFFWRLSSLQSDANNLSLDALAEAKRPLYLLFRGIVGMSGALFVFFFLQSGLIAGNLFPKFEELGFREVKWHQSVQPNPEDKNASTVEGLAWKYVLPNESGMSRLMLKSGNRRCWPECYAAFAV
ncbi:MAG: hypothetical protein FJX40_14520 [Alphaproteobacteria bacterium]|nr:hypothetical protein [Alphaproteobacteria bacterium]